MKREDSAVKYVLDGGEAIVEAYRNLGVDYVFSSPGSEWGSVWEAFARQKVNNVPGPTYLSCWHETLAVDLALGYTAVTGRMQAVLLHAGVGLLQGAMGIHGARLTVTPMVIMSGESLTFGDREGFNPGSQWYTGHNIVGGLQRVIEPVVKWASQATSPETLYDMVIRAGELAQSTPAGPVYLDVPIETMLHPWTPLAKLRKLPRAPRPRPSVADIEKLAGMLVSARNPVITTSACGRDVEGYKALLELAELLAIPVVESFVAEVSNFPKDHPLHQGFEMQPFLEGSDLVLVIRCRIPWYPPNKGPRNATVVVIDDNAFKVHMAYQNLQADMLLEGDVTSSVKLLAEAVRAARPDAARVAERKARWAAAHDRLEESYRAAEAQARARKAIDPVMLNATLAEVLPKNATYVDETTTHRGRNQRHVRYQGPQSYFRAPSGLGQGLGVALGIKLASPDRLVIPLIGDGAFLYNPVTQCLGFSKRENLPLLVVVYNNNGYRGMRNNQLSYYPEGAGARHQIFYGETIGGPAYEQLATPFDGVGIRVEDPARLKSALAEGYAAVQAGKTAIVNVVME